jgi:hypothetical protein
MGLQISEKLQTIQSLLCLIEPISRLLLYSPVFDQVIVRKIYLQPLNMKKQGCG